MLKDYDNFIFTGVIQSLKDLSLHARDKFRDP
jgi:hypothetical protein